VAIVTGTLLALGAYGALMIRLEPEYYVVDFGPAPPSVQGWTPIFQPFESDRIERVTDTMDRFEADTPILASTVGGESRAYPLTVIGGEARHKVVNDRLGGQAVAATF
jgi:hypothetical protein